MSTLPVSNFDRPEIVEEYLHLNEISACENYVFKTYIPRGARVLDLGVGAGRTTACLSRDASLYVGLDYAPQMVAVCRRRFPQLRFVVGDASDLSMFSESSFDAIVFSFNGIDYLPNDDARRRCLQECRRLLSPAGVMLFSVHNARGILFRPRLGGVSLPKKAWRLLYAAIHSVQIAFRVAGSSSFWRGHGYLWEPAAGGCRQHMATRSFVESELRSAGFEIAQVVPHDYPVRTGPFTTPWYYYAARKPQ